MNPLETVDPQSIDDLLRKDPLKLTQEDLVQNTRQMVIMLRAERLAWESEVSKAKITGKRRAGATTKKLQKAAALEAIKNAPAKLDLSAMMPGAKK